MVEASTEVLHGTISVSTISCDLDMLFSTLQQIMRRIYNLYPNKIQAVMVREHHDPDPSKTFVSNNFSLEWRSMISGRGTFYVRTMPTYKRTIGLTPTINQRCQLAS